MNIFLFFLFSYCYSEYEEQLIKDFNMDIEKKVKIAYYNKNRSYTYQAIYCITFNKHDIVIENSKIDEGVTSERSVQHLNYSFNAINDEKSVIGHVMFFIGKLLPSVKYTFMIVVKNIFKNSSRCQMMLKKRLLITHLKNKLDDLNIISYEINFYEFGIFVPFYSEGKIFNEMHDEKWKIVFCFDYESINYKIKLDLEEFNTKDFMCQYFKDYFGEVKNVKINIFIKKYLCNIGLVCSNYNKIFELGNILNGCFKKVKPKTDFTVPLFFISLIKKSGYLKKIVIDSLNFSEMDRYLVFIKILKDLGVINRGGYKIYKSMHKKLTYLVMCNINKFLIDDICYKIYNVQIENQMKGYKRFLEYIYDYIEIENEINIPELFKIIGGNILYKDLKDTRNKIIEKLNFMVNETLDSSYNYFFLDSEHASYALYLNKNATSLSYPLINIRNIIYNLNDKKN